MEETVELPQLQLVENLAGCRRHPGPGAEAVSTWSSLSGGP